MLATFADIVDTPLAEQTDGISILPTLLGEENQSQHEFMFWEFPEYGGQVAIRIGEWKVIRQHLKDDKEPTIELYNLNDDPSEQVNIAAQHPEILEEAAVIFKNEHTKAETERFQIPLIEQGLLER